MDLTAQILNALQSQHLPLPSHAWLRALISSRNPPPPLQSLVATARARLLAADLTTPGLLAAATASLPPAGQPLPDAEARLPRDVVLQVLDLENLSRSRWDQVEELEAVERGEQTRGREVVRLPPAAGDDDGNGEDEEAAAAPPPPPEDRPGPGPGTGARGPAAAAAAVAVAAAAAASSGRNATHKLVLQDCRGQKVFGLELKRINRIAVGKLNIGEKLLLKGGAVVARGMVLLEPGNCVVLGGKVDVWHRAWTENRLARLREAVGANRAD